MQPLRLHKRNGFTLIELSIVLVIIGLIIGGIVVGRDLIKVSQVKGTISAIESYKTKTMVFKTKYGGLPGDISALKATQFGFKARTGAVYYGDGNGIIDSCGGTSGSRLGCEAALAWSDLADAGLDTGLYNQNSLQANGYVNGTPAITGRAIANYLPAMPLPNLFITHVVPVGTGQNGYFLAGINSIASALGTYKFSKQIGPATAFSIDSKVDDGVPWTGNVTDTATPEDGSYGQFDGLMLCRGGISQGAYAPNDDIPGCVLVFKGIY